MSKDLYNQKGAAHLILVILLLLAIPIGIYLVQHPAIFKPKANGGAEVDFSKDAEKYGYIIELKDEPVVSQKKARPEKSVEETKDKLRVNKEEAKRDILNILGIEGSVDSKPLRSEGGSTTGSIITTEFENVFNGFLMKINKQQVEKVKQSKFVKAVYPNLEVKAFLNDSVPLMGVDKVWGLTGLQQRNITGEGVNIAILDTGIDVTHPDLGGTPITERNFEKINYVGESGLVGDDQIVVKNNKLIYSLKNTIYVYSFETGTTEEIVLPEREMSILKLSSDSDIIVYFGFSPTSSAWYYYNLSTKTHKKIADTHAYSYAYHTNGKIVYGRVLDSTNKSQIFLYDIATGTEKAISTESDSMHFPKVYGNRVIYSDYLEGNLKLYDITKDKIQIIDDYPWNVYDFNDNKLLIGRSEIKVGFDPNNPYYEQYSLCDIADRFDEKKCQKLQSIFPALTNGSSDVKTEAGFNYALGYGLQYDGSIQGSLIFFKTSSESNLVMVYDSELHRYVQINLIKNAFDISGSGKRICFVSEDGYIYCHVYDSSYGYPLPSVIFNQKVIGGYDFVNTDTIPLDRNGHGTHVAAIAAGNGALKGVAPSAKLFAYKVLDYSGRGSFSLVIAALDKAVQTIFDQDNSNNIDVISMSLGSYCEGVYSDFCGPDDPLSKAVDRAVDAGIVVVVAAGNDGPGPSTITSPGTARKAITVGAIGKDKKIASFSSKGPVKIGFETIDKPDVLAPGVSICAAQWESYAISKRCVDDKHIAISGTSMATPHIAGFIALIRQAYPHWLPQQIKNKIIEQADDLGLDKNTQGGGLVNGIKLFNANPIPTSTPLSAPKVDLKINSSDALVTARDGDSLKLSWTTVNNPDSCTALGNWTGDKSKAGGIESTGNIVGPNELIYTLVCKNSSGEAQDSVKVIILDPGCDPNIYSKKTWRVLGYVCDPSRPGYQGEKWYCKGQEVFKKYKKYSSCGKITAPLLETELQRSQSY